MILDQRTLLYLRKKQKKKGQNFFFFFGFLEYFKNHYYYYFVLVATAQRGIKNFFNTFSIPKHSRALIERFIGVWKKVWKNTLSRQNKLTIRQVIKENKLGICTIVKLF